MTGWSRRDKILAWTLMVSGVMLFVSVALITLVPWVWVGVPVFGVVFFGIIFSGIITDGLGHD